MRSDKNFDQIVKGRLRESLGVRRIRVTASGRCRYPGPRRILQITDSFDNRVDLLGGLRGLEPEAFVRAIDVSFEGATLRVISQEDFIAMKAFAGGPQDLVDAANVVGIAGESIDVDLVRRLAKRYGREAVSNLEKILDENK